MRILIADPMPKVRRALTVLLQEQPGWEVVGYAVNSIELYQQVRALNPQVILLDWDLPGLNHGRIASNLRHGKIPPVITLCWRPEFGRYAQALGLDLFISKLDGPEKLLMLVWQCYVDVTSGEIDTAVSSRRSDERQTKPIHGIAAGRKR